MAIPNDYNLETYLDRSFNFFKENQWLYNYSNVDIISDKIISTIPEDIRNCLQNLSTAELNNLDKCIPDGTAESMIQLVNLVKKLTPNIPLSPTTKCDYKYPHNSLISNKKLHEILHFAPLIDSICKEHNIKKIVDIGSGLGHLSNLLNIKYGYYVIGIECNSNYVKAANAKYNKSESIQFVEHYINEDSRDFLKSLTDNNSKYCLIGLHACADLSITILKLFYEIDAFQSLVIMPCCYHRLATTSNDSFKNFPISKIMKRFFKEYEAEEFLKTPFFRLSCQSKLFLNIDEKQLDIQAHNCLFRSLLQAVAIEKGIKIKRRKRKNGLNSSNFYSFLEKVESNFELEGDLDDFKQKLEEKWREHEKDCSILKGLLVLQSAIQAFCENIVLLDRVEIMEELGIDCKVIRVTQEELSPRCNAIIALK